MAKANRQEFIDYLLSQNGMPYVWGAQGVSLTAKNYEAEIRKRETSTKMADCAIAFTKKLLDAKITPIRAFDCSGLIMYYVQNISKLSGDLSAKWIYRSCAIKKRSDLVVGDLVFRVGSSAYHVGAVVETSNGVKIIESMGRGEGVVVRDINASGSKYWNGYGSWDKVFLPYDGQTVTPDVTQVPRYYTTVSGDRLIPIARKFGMQYKEIMELNHLVTDDIYPNMKLIVGFKTIENGSEVPEYYPVVKGDSLWKIKNLYGMTPDCIM